jgi:hypothetical protein
MRWFHPALVVLALVPAAAAAQSGKGPQVRIDFRALADDGSQIPDLKTEDITLRVNGKARQVNSLSLFRAIGAPAATDGGSSLPAPYGSNAVALSGRVIHILIDDDSISPGREGQVKEAVRLLTSELAPGDRIGVLTTQGQLNMRPAGDPTKVRLAVDALTGRGGSAETKADSQCRTVRVLAGLSSMLALTGGAPTTIVVFSGGLAKPEQKIIDMTRRSVATEASAAAATNDICPVRPEDFENIGILASSARADLYLFHLTEAMATRSSDLDAGFESLAGVTGAEFVRLAASPQASISRLLRETAAYYTATFEADPGERTGITMRVDLKPTREKVKLRTRPSVAIPKVEAKAAQPKDMLRVAGERTDLPLRVTAYTSRTAGSEEVTIAALFEGVEANTALSAASIGLFDGKGTLKKQWSAQSGELSKRPVTAALTAPPGTYRLRVAAVDASGRAGTADYELNAEIPRADPLKLSALVLGTQQPGGGFAPRLEFSNEPVAIGYLEIYGVPKGGAVTVDLDVATTANGAPLANAQTTVNQGKSEDMRIAFGGFSIATLEPGDYQMRAIVSLDGKPVGKVVRTLRKSK